MQFGMGAEKTTNDDFCTALDLSSVSQIKSVNTKIEVNPRDSLGETISFDLNLPLVSQRLEESKEVDATILTPEKVHRTS